MEGEPLEFGFVPGQIVRDLGEIGNWKVRADAIETLQRLVGSIRCAPVETIVGVTLNAGSSPCLRLELAIQKHLRSLLLTVTAFSY